MKNKYGKQQQNDIYLDFFQIKYLFIYLFIFNIISDRSINQSINLMAQNL